MDDDLVRQLNEDVWHPFRQAYGKLDAPAFLSLYSPDLIRAGGPAKEVLGYAEFAAQTESWFADLAERGSAVSISFRFVERIVAGDVASERGIFQLVATRADGDGRTFYGRFHTYSRRTDGRWRICVDYDTDERSETLEEEFQAAAAVDDLDAFKA